MAVPYGLWTLDEDPAQDSTSLADSGSGGNTGTLTTGDGATNKSVAGHSAKAISLDGTNDYIQIATAGNFTMDLTTFTVSAWVKNVANDGILASRGGGASGGGAGGWFVDVDASGVEVVFKDNAGGNKFVCDSPFTFNFNDGNWHLITCVLTYDSVTQNNNVAVIYVDGVDVTQAPTRSGTPQDVSENLRFGARKSAGSITTFLQAQLDDCRYYKASLTAAEVLALYRGIAPKAQSYSRRRR